MLIQTLKNTWSIFLGITFLVLGNGLQGTLTGWRATFEGFGSTVTGFVITGYSIGFLLGSVMTPTLVSRVGHIRVFAAMASMASASVLVQILYIDPLLWLMTRFITGVCFAGAFVIVESWLNARSDDRSRGQMLSIYMIVNFASMAGGQWLLLLADPTRFDLFLVASILLSMALVPVLISRISAPDIQLHQRMGIAELLRHAPSGTWSVFLAGISHGSLYGMGAVYAARAEMSVPQTAVFMSAFILLGALLQWPAGWLSDRMDRRVVIVGAASLALLMCSLLYLIAFPLAWFIAGFAVLGGSSLIIYSLAVSTTNDRLLPTQMVGAGANIALLWGAGAMLGPPTIGMMLDVIGLDGFFLHLGLVHLFIIIICLYYIQRHKAPDEADQTPFIAVAPRSTVVAMETVAHESEEAQLASEQG
jgi:MFS family permease